jgi:hypothetical protein
MRIVIEKFKSIVDRSITDAEDLLWERLLWTEGANRFEMDIGAIEDDMSFRKRGSYFVTYSSIPQRKATPFGLRARPDHCCALVTRQYALFTP